MSGICLKWGRRGEQNVITGEGDNRKKAFQTVTYFMDNPIKI